MQRLHDWEARLSEFIAGNRNMPFVWGERDCILFSISAVEAMTGLDAAVAYRGRYSDARGAALALRELGEGTLIKTITSHFAPKPIGKAQRGDIVLCEGSAGICIGGKALFVGEERLAESAGVPMRVGLVEIDRSHWSKAWAV